MRREIMARHAELVPRTRPVPALPRPVRPVRAWLRALFIPPPVRSHLAPGEQVLITSRRRWAVPLWRLARGGTMMTAVGVLTVLLPGFLLVQLALALGALVHTAWIGWCVLEWRVEQIAVTDSRLIRVHGILNVNVDAVQLSQVTDATLRCTIPGRILGYGTVIIETAGQRPVGRLDYVPRPTAVYRGLLR